MKKQIITSGILLCLGTGATIAQNAAYDQNGPTPIGGSNSSGFGFQALPSNIGSDNTALGNSALFSNNQGFDNTAAGSSAMYFNTTGRENSSFGRFSLYNNSTGDQNVAIGGEALFSSTYRSGLVAVGFEALFRNLHGNYNTAVGHMAQFTNYDGSWNTSVGYETLYNNLSGHLNAAVGYRALYTNNGGHYNSAFGEEALLSNDGTYNTATGASALRNNTSGADNSALGAKTGMINTVGWGNTYVGANADCNSGSWTNSSAIGYQSVADASDRVWLGNANIANGDVWSFGTYNTVSDGRFKTNVKAEDVKGIEFIRLLRPVVYNFDAAKATEFKCKNMPDSIRKAYLNTDFSRATAIRQSGFIAQEVADAAKKSGYNFDGVTIPVDDNGMYSIAYAQLVVPLVKAVQEQQQQIEQQKEEYHLQLMDLQRQLEEQKELIASMQKTATGINSPGAVETGFSLSQNEPNPFTHETLIKYTLPQNVSQASVIVYDLSGKQITSFPIVQKGSASLSMTSEKLSAGIYIYSIVADGKIMDSKRMVVAEK